MSSKASSTRTSRVLHGSVGNSSVASAFRSRGNTSSVWSAKDIMRVDTESGFHDPVDAPRGLGESLVSHQDLVFSSADEQSYLLEFEARKTAMGFGFAPAWSGFMLLANTLLGGSGMLGIPHAFSVAGYVLGVVFLIFFGCCSAFGCHLLACCAKKVCRVPCSFYSTSSVVVPRWTWLVDGAVAVKCFGVATSYLIIIGDLFPEAMKGFGVYNERWLYVVIAWLIAAALSCLKTLNALRYTASIAIVIVVWTAVLIVLFYFRVGDEFQPCPGNNAGLPCYGGELKKVGSDYLALFQGLPVFIFGFTCQQNIFTICNEVSNVSSCRINGIIISAYFVSACAFGVTAMLGYMTYGDHVKADVLKQYPSNVVIGITKIVFSMLVTFSYPLQIHPSRTSWLALWRVAIPSGEAHSQSRWDSQQAGVEGMRHNIVSACLIFASLALALVVTNLGLVLGIVGATGSTMVSYILPGLVYFVTFKQWSVKRFLALAQFCLGCVIMPTCLIVLFIPSG